MSQPSRDGWFVCQSWACQGGNCISRLSPYPWKLNLSQPQILEGGGNSFMLLGQFGENAARLGNVYGLAFTQTTPWVCEPPQ